MQTILQDLYYGRICPDAKQFAHGGEYERAITAASDYEQKLRAQLTEEQTALLELFQQAQIRIAAIAGREDFIQGFRLGANLMLELQDKNDGEILDLR